MHDTVSKTIEKRRGKKDKLVQVRTSAWFKHLGKANGKFGFAIGEPGIFGFTVEIFWIHA